jgi:transcription antitermination factor NusG
VSEFGGALPVSVLQRSPNELLVTEAAFALDGSSWFAIQTRPRYEKKVTAELREKGIRAFLPLCSVIHHWSDRRRSVQMTVFPSYVFVKIAVELNARISVLRTNGVIGFVGVRGMGTPIPDDEIEAVQTLIERRIPFEPYPYLRVGQRVCIRGGSLDGVKGFLKAVNFDESLVISVELIQRSIAMRIEGYRVEPA